jgi:hypothetical protein
MIEVNRFYKDLKSGLILKLDYKNRPIYFPLGALAL